MLDGEGELVGEGRGARGGRPEQAPEPMVEAAEYPVEQDVLGTLNGGERGLGIAEAGESMVPFSDRAGSVVILGSTRGPAWPGDWRRKEEGEIPDQVRGDGRGGGRTPRLATHGARR